MPQNKTTLCLLLSVVLLFCAACGAFAEASEPDYDQIGLKVADVLSMIVDSEDYLSVLGSPETFREAREKANTHDYDRPVAVYSVILNDPKAVLEELIRANQKSLDTWNRLPPVLQDQLLRRFTVQSLCATVNGRMGTSYIALASVANAVIQDETLTAQNSFCRLYIFEKGTPILVSFGTHVASGQFLFIPQESQKSSEAIKSCLGVPGLEIVPVPSPLLP